MWQGREKSSVGIDFRQGYARFLRILVYWLPPLLYCSYYPLLNLGGNESTNFEFSLPEIWLLLFFVATLPILQESVAFYWRETRLVRLLALATAAFWIYAGLSLLWTPNLLRGILTWGLMGLTFYAAFVGYFVLQNYFDASQRRLILRIFILSAVAFAALGILQCVLDVLGVTSATTLLCDGCTYTAFGFPRLSGLAIEPQFMGNLLLAPTLLTLYAAVHTQTQHRVWAIVISVFLVMALTLTLSRGAIYAFAIGVILMLIGAFVWRYDRRWLVANRRRQAATENTCQIVKKWPKLPNRQPNRGVENVEKFSALWLLIVLPVAGAILGLSAQGVMAAASPTNDTFWSGVTKSVHQLSLGLIDLRPKPEAMESSDATEPVVDSTFSGYVPESTDVRLNLNELALDIWDDSTSHFLSGVGLGGAGVALSDKSGVLSSKEIVQNQYLSVLLELGIVGALLLVIALFYLLRILAWQRYAVFSLALTVSYLISLCFFAGLPNALHLYLFPALLLATLPFCAKNDKIKTHAQKTTK